MSPFQRARDLADLSRLACLLCAFAGWWLSVLYCGIRFGPNFGQNEDGKHLSPGELVYEIAASCLHIGLNGFVLLVAGVIFLRSWFDFRDMGHRGWVALARALVTALWPLAASTGGVLLGWLFASVT